MDQVVVDCSEGMSKKPHETAADLELIKARRTAFISRFIVLREGKRSRAHRKIELLEWYDHTTAEELADLIRASFIENGDNMTPVERDLKRALAHASRSLNHFISEYATRASKNFVEALWDYDRSNSLLFGHDERPKPGGWRLPQEIDKLKNGTYKRNS